MTNAPDDLDSGQTIRGFAEGQKVFGRYILKHILGRGGMGVVWLAVDEKLEEEVALKFMPETVRLDQVAVDELKRETRKSRLLTHPGIVRIHDFLEEGGFAAISMEFIDGPTLAQKRLEKPARCFEAEEIREWVLQVCEALDYAHREARVVHRDLKPANIMLTSSGKIKITDFGISRSISDSMSQLSVLQSRPGSGSPPYMSPQQILGEPSSEPDDIYSLGATIYDLLTGKPPFFSGDIVRQIETRTPPPMTDRRREFHPELPPLRGEWESLVASCLAKDPADRPESVQEIRRRMTCQDPGPYAIPQAAGVTHRSARRWVPLWAALAGGLLFLTVVAGAVLFWMKQPQEQSVSSPPDQVNGTTSAQKDPAEPDPAVSEDVVPAGQPPAAPSSRVTDDVPPSNPLLARAQAEIRAAQQVSPETLDKMAIAFAELRSEARRLAGKSVVIDGYVVVVPANEEVWLSNLPLPTNYFPAYYGKLPKDQRVFLLSSHGKIVRAKGIIEMTYGGMFRLLLTSVAIPGPSPPPAEEEKEAARLAYRQMEQGKLTGLAQAGDPEAQFVMGYRLVNGDAASGVRIDEKLALPWLEKAVKQEHSLAAIELACILAQSKVTEEKERAVLLVRDHLHALTDLAVREDAIAQLCLGYLYKAGIGVDEDDKEAVKWFRLSAEQGNAMGQNNLGWMYSMGRGVERDDKEAVKWYRLSAGQGDAVGQNQLGYMYAKGRGVERDDKEAVKWYRLSAEQGSAMGQNNLGWMYSMGRGVERDDKEAVKWYRLSAGQGDAVGQNQLGRIYKEGRGVERDDKEAVKWFRLSAGQRDAQGLNNLGYMYQEGRGVERDDKVAVKWYRLSAEQGNAEGQNQLGYMYYKRRGVEQDDKEAVKWFRLSAEQGNALGQNNLGWIYQEGCGVERDDKEAVKWFRLSAEQGNALGQNNLGSMYQLGRGVERDDKEAVKWFRLSANQGNEDSKKKLKKLREQ